MAKPIYNSLFQTNLHCHYTIPPSPCIPPLPRLIPLKYPRPSYFPDLQGRGLHAKIPAPSPLRFKAGAFGSAAVTHPFYAPFHSPGLWRPTFCAPRPSLPQSTYPVATPDAHLGRQPPNDGNSTNSLAFGRPPHRVPPSLSKNCSPKGRSAWRPSASLSNCVPLVKAEMNRYTQTGTDVTSTVQKNIRNFYSYNLRFMQCKKICKYASVLYWLCLIPYHR